MFRLKKKGQSTLEFAILIVVIIGALIAMQTFIKRGYQGRLRNASDDMGEQFSPGYTRNKFESKTFSYTEEVTSKSGLTENEVKEQLQTRAGRELVSAAADEFWGVSDPSDSDKFGKKILPGEGSDIEDAFEDVTEGKELELREVKESNLSTFGTFDAPSLPDE